MKESGTSKSIEKFLTRRRCDVCDLYIVRIFVDDPAILQWNLRTNEIYLLLRDPESRYKASRGEVHADIDS